MNETTLEPRIEAVRDQATALLAALRAQIEKLALGGEPVIIPEISEAKFTLEHDPYDDRQTLMASFYPAPHYRAGVLLFHSDGSCYAEYHVMRQYPAKPQWFVESAEAWVRDGKVVTDFRLIAMPS